MKAHARNIQSNHAFRKIEQIMKSRPAPGISIVKKQKGLGTDTYSSGIYGQNGDHVTPDTVYDLASIAKLYTAALVLRQVEAGNVSLDDKFNKYLANPRFKHSLITVRNLLSHRVKFGLRLAEYRQMYPKNFKSALLDIQIPSRSSETVNYHNLGFIYLGYMLETVTGCSLDEQMKTLFKSLGLMNTYTGFSLEGAGIFCPATGTLSDGSVVENFTHDESARLHGGLAGNAGVFASVRDLARFAESWLDGSIVGKKVLNEALQNYDKSGEKPQALGWWMRLKNGEILPEHTFCHPSFTGCFVGINTHTREVLAVTTNSSFGVKRNPAICTGSKL